jgi:hypothetical protein
LLEQTQVRLLVRKQEPKLEHLLELKPELKLVLMQKHLPELKPEHSLELKLALMQEQRLVHLLVLMLEH